MVGKFLYDALTTQKVRYYLFLIDLPWHKTHQKGLNIAKELGAALAPLKDVPSLQSKELYDYSIIYTLCSRTSIFRPSIIGMEIKIKFQKMAAVTMDTGMLIFCACADAHIHCCLSIKWVDQGVVYPIRLSLRCPDNRGSTVPYIYALHFQRTRILLLRIESFFYIPVSSIYLQCMQ